MKKYYLLTLLSVFSLKSSELNEQMKKDFYQSFPTNRLGNHGTIEFYPYANRISIVFNTPVEARTPEGYFEKKGKEYQSLYNDVQRRFPKIEISLALSETKIC